MILYILISISLIINIISLIVVIILERVDAHEIMDIYLLDSRVNKLEKIFIKKEMVGMAGFGQGKVHED